MTGRDLRIILLGAPGAGKGTQSRRLSRAFGVPQIATGDMFRTAAAQGSQMGVAAKAYMDKGELVPDDVTIGVVEERLRQADAARGFIMDGFPRTPQQATALDALLRRMQQRLQAVVEIDVPRAELIRRLTSRYWCSVCQATYNMSIAPPSTQDRCDRCDGQLIQREDDREETVVHRLDVYERQTTPLVSYYEGAGLLKRIDGTLPIDEVYEAILHAVGMASGSAGSAGSAGTQEVAS